MKLRWKMKPTSGLKHELLANIGGVGWSALAQLVCIPLYIKFLGIEAFGLIGFYLVLQALLQILDFGLSPTINREMARYSVQPEKAAEARDLVRTLEAGYWLIGLIIGGAIMAASPWLATHWIKATAIPVHAVKQAVMLMGVLAVFQWPFTFYQGGLMGLRRQVLLNTFRVITTTLTSGGAVLVVWLVSPTITAFLLWQIAVSAVQAVLFSFLLWRSLSGSAWAARFRPGLIRNIWRFAAGMSGIAIVGLLLTQIDKVLVSKLLSLRVFGYYALAWSVAGGLLIIAGAVFNVIFPRMSAQVAAGDNHGVRQSYHRGAQLMAVVILPLAAVLSLFSFDVLHLWTRSVETAAMTAPILRVLVVGSALNSLLNLPYALQLAFGWTKLSFLAGLAAVAVIIPLMFPMIKHFGPVGAAAMWVVLNFLNLVIVVPIMHRRLLPGELWRYFGDVGWPLISVAGTTILVRWAFANVTSQVLILAVLASAWLASSVVAVLAAPQVRSWTLARLMKTNLEGVRGVGSFT
jgi:O-antigen/teichoic acid export membrane protein